MHITIKKVPWASLSPAVKTFYIIGGLINIAAVTHQAWSVYRMYKQDQHVCPEPVRVRTGWE